MCINKKLVIYLFLGLILTGCTLCYKSDEYIVMKIAQNESLVTIEVMDNDGNISSYNTNSSAIKDISLGDQVKIKHANEKVLSIDKIKTEDKLLSGLSEDICNIPSLKEKTILFYKEDLIESYFLDETKIIDGIALLPSKQGDLTTAIVVCSNDPKYFERMFNDITEGYKATYQDNKELMNLIDKATIKYFDRYAVMIISDTSIKNEIISLINKSEVIKND